MEEIIKEVIASAIGALIGGLFTILGVRMTLAYERSKERKQEAKERKEKDEICFKNRPRLETLSYKKIDNYRPAKSTDACVIQCEIKGFKNEGGRALFNYDPKVTDLEQWECIQYTFKNTGYTEINHMYISTNLEKSTAIFDILNDEQNLCCDNNFLNYSVFVEKTIKPQSTFKLCVCYVKDEIITSPTSAPLTIWLVDENRNWWSQSLFSPTDKIYDSVRASHKEWRETTDIKTAIECFNNPMLW